MTYLTRASDTYVARRLSPAYDVSMSFGANLRRAMAAADVDHAELGRRVGISRPAVTQWLSGATQPSPKRLSLIAAALGTTVSSLFNELPGAVGRDGPQKISTSVEKRMLVRKNPPKPGEPLDDPDELALIRMWRELSLVKKAALFAHLGADEMPSLGKVA